MTTSTKAATTHWSNWSMPTKILVGLGAIAAVLVVAYLYVA